MRHAAKQAEDLYAAIVANSPRAQVAGSADPPVAFDPTRPRSIDWESLLRQAATDLLENQSLREEKQSLK